MCKISYVKFWLLTHIKDSSDTAGCFFASIILKKKKTARVKIISPPDGLYQRRASSFFRHKQHLCGQTALVSSPLTKGCTSSLKSFSRFFLASCSLAWRCLLCSFSWSKTSQSTPVRSSDHLSDYNSRLPESFTGVPAVVLGSLDTCLTTFFPESLKSLLPISARLVLYRVALFEFLDETSHSTSWHLKTLW